MPPDVPILGSVPQQSPVDFPLPVLITKVHSFRILAGAPGEIHLRYTPIMPVGPGQWAPSSDHHTEVVFTSDSLCRPGGLFSLMAENMTPDQRAEARARFAEPVA